MSDLVIVGRVPDAKAQSCEKKEQRKGKRHQEGSIAQHVMLCAWSPYRDAYAGVIRRSNELTIHHHIFKPAKYREGDVLKRAD